tara:strand:+ start:298 stop:816 length:519 start_codon:yes stop_codon:yes gene_type:complete
MRYCFFLCLILLFGCVNNIKDIDEAYLESIINDHGEGVEIRYYLEGNLEFQLFASEMEVFSDEKNLFPKGIKVYVFNNNLDTIATIFSDFAIHNKNDALIEIRRNVILKNNKNEQLSTERLFWSKDTKKIYTKEEDLVTLNTEKQIIMGYGFVSDQYFSTYSLSNITGTIYL